MPREQPEAGSENTVGCANTAARRTQPVPHMRTARAAQHGAVWTVRGNTEGVN